MVFAIDRARRAFVSASLPNDAPATRGLESTLDATNARVFADQDAVDAFVEAHGGTVGDWLAMEIPALG